MNKESFVFYKSFYEAIKNIPKEDQLELYTAICEYSFTDNVPDLPDGIAKAMFILMKPNIDSANARYRASVENGKKGGRPKKNKNLEKPNNNLDETQEEPKQNLNDNVDDNVDDNVNKDDNITPYEKIKDLFHEICVSYPKVIKLSDSRKKTIKARYKEYNYDIEAFKRLFTKAEESDFLKGNNDKNWSANFDWLINPQNMIKVLENRYENKEVNNASTKQPTKRNGSEFAEYD